VRALAALNLAGMAFFLLFLLGIVSGLRTFTGPAVLWLTRHGGVFAYVLAGAAIFEYFYDVQPQAPPRTSISNIISRLLSGVFVGWWGAVAAGVTPGIGAALGAAGALAGAYCSLPIRKRCIDIGGNLASGLLEDIVAIGAAALIVTHL